MWPITEYPVGLSNLFIIDPLYTLPLLIGLVLALVQKQFTPAAQRANIYGIVLSSLYIVWSLGAKIYIDQKIESALKQQNIDYHAYVSTPAPFTTFLWRTVAIKSKENNLESENETDDIYYEIYASVFDDVSEVSITAYPSQTVLLADIKDAWGVQRLQWFTKGAYAVSKYDNKVVLSDLRMGTQCFYVFNFVVGVLENDILENDTVVLSDFERHSNRPALDKLGIIWDRIWDASIDISPKKCEAPLLGK